MKLGHLKLLTLTALLIFTGCSSPQTNHGSPNLRGSKLLVPFGNFRHFVKLTIHDPKASSHLPKMNFEGLIQNSSDSVKLTAFSPFGTTLLKVQLIRATQQVDAEIFISAMKKHEDKVREYFKLVATLFPATAETAEWKITSTNSDGRPTLLETVKIDPPATVRIEKYDSNLIPEKIRMESQAFEVEISVTDYELN